MSERNGDRARFQKNRKRKLRHRRRIREFVKTLRAQPPTASRRGVVMRNEIPQIFVEWLER